MELLRKWAIECNIAHVHLDKLLAILRTKLLPDLPRTSKIFLKTISSNYEIRTIQDEYTNYLGEYVYFGIENSLKECINPELHTERTIFLQINVDGLPLFASNKKQLWPILCKIHFKPDIYKPFLVSLYFGDTKPYNVNKFLFEFVNEINNLQRHGIMILETV